MQIEVTLNEVVRQLEVEPFETLLAVLRREGMVSVRYGSDTGETGASAVLIDGRLVNTDCMLALQAHGHEIITLEWFNHAEMHPIQAAFVATGAMQSGYTTPAMILGTYELLQRIPDPSDEQIRDMLSGILDRETAYVKPVEAVHRAAAILRGDEVEPFGPLVLPPLTDGKNAAVYDPADPAPRAWAC